MHGQRASRWLAAGVALHLLLTAGVVLAAADNAADGSGRTAEARVRPGTVAQRPAETSDPWADIQAVETYAREHLGDTFAGLYLEDAGPSNDGTVVVSFTEAPPPEHEQAMRALLGDRAIRFRVVEHSLSALEQKQDEITQAMAELERQGVEIAWVGVNVMTNRVTVAVTGSHAAAEAVLRERFGGEMLEVIQGERPVPLSGEVRPGEAGDAVPDAQAQADVRRPVQPQGEQTPEQAPERLGFWQRLLTALRSWWRTLFD